MPLINLEEVESVFDGFWFWSYEKNNLASFKRKNYIHYPKLNPIESVKKKIYDSTGDAIDEALLLTNLSYIGYCFNPISIYICKTQQKVSHLILEVTNTPWGERHHYISKVNTTKSNCYQCEFIKKLHVSPFMEMDYTYDISCKLTEDKIILHIKNLRDNKVHFDATLSLDMSPINSKNLASCLITKPWMTGKVIFAIYWQALILWLKKVRVVSHTRKQT